MPAVAWLSAKFLNRHRRKADNLEQFRHSFENLTLSPEKDDHEEVGRVHRPELPPPPPPPPKPRRCPPDFVGGFRPDLGASPTPPPSGRRIVSSPSPAAAPGFDLGPLPRPPAMPVPQISLTMQHALSTFPHTTCPQPGLGVDAPLTRPVSASAVQPQAQPVSAPRTRRAASVPPSPSTSVAASVTVQCSGSKQNGERCTRPVKLGPPIVMHDPDLIDEIERFCWQHRDKLLKPSGFYLKNTFLPYEDYIPSYLHPNTQAALRIEMANAPSEKDEPGYIYTYEIKDPDNPHLMFKVGRTKKLIKRLDDWDKQCASKEQFLRGWWPNGPKNDTTDRLNGRVRPGPAGKCSHRLERLIHIELADLAMSWIYLDPNWPRVMAKNAIAETESNSGSMWAALGKKGMKQMKEVCPDCGREHKEIFSFARFPQGRMHGKEWEDVVRPVIERWGRFVEEHL